MFISAEKGLDKLTGCVDSIGRHEMHSDTTTVFPPQTQVLHAKMRFFADDGRKEVASLRNVERAGAEGAPESWTPIPGWYVVPGLDEVTEFLLERR